MLIQHLQAFAQPEHAGRAQIEFQDCFSGFPCLLGSSTIAKVAILGPKI